MKSAAAAVSIYLATTVLSVLTLDIKKIKDRKIILRKVAGKLIFVWLRSM
jgi:heme exporter protein D